MHGKECSPDCFANAPQCNPPTVPSPLDNVTTLPSSVAPPSLSFRSRDHVELHVWVQSAWLIDSLSDWGLCRWQQMALTVAGRHQQAICAGYWLIPGGEVTLFSFFFTFMYLFHFPLEIFLLVYLSKTYIETFYQQHGAPCIVLPQLFRTTLTSCFRSLLSHITMAFKDKQAFILVLPECSVHSWKWALLFSLPVCMFWPGLEGTVLPDTSL